LQYCLQVERRAADDLQHVGSRGLLLQGLTQFAQQPGVLDGDDGLGSEVGSAIAIKKRNRLGHTPRYLRLRWRMSKQTNGNHWRLRSPSSPRTATNSARSLPR